MPPSGGRGSRWKVGDKTTKLVTVAASQYRVDPLIAFLEAQATLSDRVGDDASRLVALPIGCQHPRPGVHVLGGHRKRGRRRLSPIQMGVESASNDASRGQQNEEKEHEQQGTDESEQRTRTPSEVLVPAKPTIRH